MCIRETLQGENQTGSHQKQSINACGTVPPLDRTVAEVSVAEGQKVGKNISMFSSLQKALTKTKDQVHHYVTKTSCGDCRVS